ncbi:major histocompatibility complex class I-related gene protein-like [Alligator sinensis]|uniref:Major histocompatibility complex class I-related gene protein-like n=1 Tax=Alligator sinensis TaxID=38654 RepID=A0A1U7S6Y9_ALLSI|nr:major histocompatibility complex class I-related gene protein-like [Alligator sinensis]
MLLKKPGQAPAHLEARFLSASLLPAPLGSHSYRSFYTGVSDPGPDLPAFTALSYVDDQQILHYDSETQRVEPRADWVQGAVDPDYWDRETETLRGWEQKFRVKLRTLQFRYNQTGGSHTLQLMYSCELGEDGSPGAYVKLGYDGRDFLSYDPKKRTWAAAPAETQVTQRRLNEYKAFLQSAATYMEETCIEWLQKYLQHGKAALQSKHPVAQVNDRPSSRDGLTTLSCWVHGFYPKDVAVVWLKNGEAQPQETSRSRVLPSGDGTYQIWATIEINPSRNHDYTCSVEHVSLGAALRVALDKSRVEPEFNLMLITGLVVTVVLVVAVSGSAVSFLRRQGVGYRAAPAKWILVKSAPPPEGLMEEEREQHRATHFSLFAPSF